MGVLARNSSGRIAAGAVWAASSAVRIAPWIVFGPITGCLSELAFRAFRRKRPVEGVLWLVLNVSILLGLIGATALIARRI